MGGGVSHSFNCAPAFVDMRIADTLVSVFILFFFRGKLAIFREPKMHEISGLIP